MEDIELELEEERQLQAKYPNQYIAVCDGDVVAAGDEITAVMTEAKRIAKGRKDII